MSPTTVAPVQVRSASQATTHGTPAFIIDAFARAMDRARAAKLVAFRTGDADVYEVPSVSAAGAVHTVRVTGRRWYDLTCDCRGANHPACQHRAVVAWARKYHATAVRPVALCPVCNEQPAIVGSEMCAQCAAVQVAEDAAYAPDAPVTASPIYAETMRDLLVTAPARSRVISTYNPFA